MERLKRGDVCPLCGGEIETADPFVLGYLTAVRDLLQKGRFEEPAPETPASDPTVLTEAELFERYLASGWEDIIDFYEYQRRFIEHGGTVKEARHEEIDG